jgi:hypothetical protein
MLATKLKGTVTTDRKLIVDVPNEVTPGAVEVILLREQPLKRNGHQSRRKVKHPAFGLWAKRTDIKGSASF